MLSFLILHGKKRVEEVSKSLSASGDGSGKRKRRDARWLGTSQRVKFGNLKMSGVRSLGLDVDDQ